MTKKLGFCVDVQKCIGCFTCAMACKNQYHQETGIIWRQVYPVSEKVFPHRERAFYSLSCNHCENPKCLEVCPESAYTKRAKDGVVVLDQSKCTGCGDCISACPYGAPQYNPVLKKAEKCSLCWERLDAGIKPGCVEGCPTDALTLIDLETFDEKGTIKFPPGFPNSPTLNPSIRFRMPQLPKIIRRESA